MNMQEVKSVRVRLERGSFVVRLVKNEDQLAYAEYRRLDSASDFWVRVGSPLRTTPWHDCRPALELISDCVQGIVRQFGEVLEIDPDWTDIPARP
jgi:hypothetical protein